MASSKPLTPLWALLTFFLLNLHLVAAVDEWVLNAQKWVNQQYGSVPGYVKSPENGKTGWPTMYSLTRALQYEVGIAASDMSDTFGPTTLSLVTSKLGNIGPNSPKNVILIVQSGLYCKGYSGDSLSGVYTGETHTSVRSLRNNMGFGDDRSTLSPKEFKALLTMDAYVTLEGGRNSVRTVQQWMNQQYYSYSWFFIVPCDGYFSRDVQKALVYALQTQLGVSGANGNVGPATRAAIKSGATVRVGSTGTLVKLFQAAMIFNYYEVAFDGTFSSAMTSQVNSFQSFVGIPVTGAGDYQTWLSLLISTGDPDRRGTAVDCVTMITPARASTLTSLGYKYVGRYLSNVPNTSLNKKIQDGELANIFAASLRVYPIYQTNGMEASYFNTEQGKTDAKLAVSAATAYGFQRGTIIYFAVDFDAMDDDITNNVIPHFRAINDVMDYYGNPYRIGVYASRNPCSRLYNAGLTVSSFVSDMSTGFSGNLGFPMPKNWAFDQISTITVGSGSGSIEIDNNIASGRDTAQSSVISRPAPLDTTFNQAYRSQLYTEVNAYKDQVKSNQLGLTHSMDDALDVLMSYDVHITNLARSYGVRKALIQTPVFWEYWKQNYGDPVADANVQNYYAYMEAYEAWQKLPIGPAPTFPIGGTDDSSVGIAQIFARTAVKARNWAVSQSLINGNTINADDWHQLEDVWKKLHDDGFYNIGTVPLVLFQGGTEVGVNGIRLTYTEDETRLLFQRYNGFGDGAVQYGHELLGAYKIFEKYNALSR
ncbi:hypothetical protein HK104_004555 [Borealophlyctis nickersoniae]|nr:hypothetical protein HK104_004555 [Borealophlyctis nickersoniae]